MKSGIGSILSAAMAIAVAIAALSGPARAADDRPEAARGGPPAAGDGRGGGKHAVPEFDPAAAGAIAALLAGGALTLASRRSR